MQKLFKIPRQNMHSFQEKIAFINKKADKLGKDRVEILEVGGETVEKRIPSTRGDRFEYTEIVWVSVSGETPMLDGWTFLAAYDYSLGNDKAIIRMPAGLDEDQIPPEHRERGPVCDHCQTKRNRNNVYLLAHEDGRTLLVGSTCIADFLGSHGTDPEKVAAWATWIYAQIDGLQAFEDGDHSGGTRTGFSLVDFLPRVAAHIRVDGWTSATAARDTNRVSTADQTIGWWFASSQEKDKADPDWRESVRPTVEDRRVASESIDWSIAKGESPDANNYLTNLAIIAEAGWVTFRLASYAASMVSSYLRDRDKLTRKQTLREKIGANRPSEHVGEIKKRDTWDAYIIRKSGFEGRYGWTTVLGLMTTDGDVLTWFASGDPSYKNSDDEPAVGDHVSITGTVKKHDEYKGEAQTAVTRCKLTKEG